MRYSVILFVLSFFLITPSVAQESKETDTKKIANDLAGCGGVFSAMSKTLFDMNKSAAAKTFEDTARGGYLGAAYLLYIDKHIPIWKNALSWAENRKESEKNYWLGLLELYQATPEKVFPDDFMKQVDFCTALNPIQTELVELMRKTIYSQEQKTRV